MTLDGCLYPGSATGKPLASVQFFDVLGPLSKAALYFLAKVSINYTQVIHYE